MARQIIDPDGYYQVELNGGRGDQRDLVVGGICASLIDDLPLDDQRPVAVVAAVRGTKGMPEPYIGHLRNWAQFTEGFAVVDIPLEPAIEAPPNSDYAFEFKLTGRTTEAEPQQPPGRSKVTVTARSPWHIAENASPRPRDRVFVSYGYFNDIQGRSTATGEAQFERTMMDASDSIGMRMPIESAEAAVEDEMQVILRFATAPTSTPLEDTVLFFNDIGVGYYLNQDRAPAFSIVPEGFVAVETAANPLAPLSRAERVVDRSPAHRDRLKQSQMSAEKFRWLRTQVAGWGAVGEVVRKPLTLQQFREYFRKLALNAGIAATEKDTDESAEAVFADATDVIKFSYSEGLDPEALAVSRTTFPLLDSQNRVVGGVHLPPARRAA